MKFCQKLSNTSCWPGYSSHPLHNVLLDYNPAQRSFADKFYEVLCNKLTCHINCQAVWQCWYNPPRLYGRAHQQPVYICWDGGEFKVEDKSLLRRRRCCMSRDEWNWEGSVACVVGHFMMSYNKWLRDFSLRRGFTLWLCASMRVNFSLLKNPWSRFCLPRWRNWWREKPLYKSLGGKETTYTKNSSNSTHIEKLFCRAVCVVAITCYKIVPWKQNVSNGNVWWCLSCTNMAQFMPELIEYYRRLSVNDTNFCQKYL